MTQHDTTHREVEGTDSATASKAHTTNFTPESDKPPSICVVEAVAEVIETDPTEFGPLYEVIDPDALDLLLESPHQFQEGCITFRFAGCDVTVDADGWITVSPE